MTIKCNMVLNIPIIILPDDYGYEFLRQRRKEYLDMLKNTPHSDEEIKKNAEQFRTKLNEILEFRKHSTDNMQITYIDLDKTTHIEIWYITKTNQTN